MFRDSLNLMSFEGDDFPGNCAVDVIYHFDEDAIPSMEKAEPFSYPEYIKNEWNGKTDYNASKAEAYKEYLAENENDGDIASDLDDAIEESSDGIILATHIVGNPIIAILESKGFKEIARFHNTKTGNDIQLMALIQEQAITPKAPAPRKRAVRRPAARTRR